ncbi:unnamed protein product [Penicillium pancosmium]
MASPGTLLEFPERTTPLVPESPDESWFVDQNSTIFDHMPSPGMHRQNQAALRSDGEHDREPGDDTGDPCLAYPGDDTCFKPRTPPFALRIGGSNALVDGRRLLGRFGKDDEPLVQAKLAKSLMSKNTSTSYRLGML